MGEQSSIYTSSSPLLCRNCRIFGCLPCTVCPSCFMPMSNLLPRVSHQECCCLVMHTTPLPFLKKSGPLATLHKGMWMRTRLISNQKITYMQLVSSPIYSGMGRTPSLLRIEVCGVAGGISEYLLHREAGSLN